MNTTTSRINLGSLTKSQLFGEYLFCLVFFGSIEIFWRNSDSEFWDILGIFFLFFGFSVILLRTNMGAKVLDRLKVWKVKGQHLLESIELGLDFRPQKEELARFTKIEKGVFILLFLLGITLLYKISLPLLLENYLIKFSAVAYLLTLSMIWGGTLTFVIVIAVTGLSSLWENISSLYPKVNRYFILLGTILLTFALISVLKKFLPPTITLVTATALSLIPYLLFEGHEAERPYLLYGIKGRSKIRSLALIQWTKSYLVFSTLFVSLWGTLLIGGTVLNSQLILRFPKTQFLGELFLWLWSIQRIYLLSHLHYWKKQAPVQDCPKVLWVEKEGEFSLKKEIITALKKKNWKVVYQTQLPKRDEADLKLGFLQHPQKDHCGVPSLNVTQEQLDSPAAIFIIENKEQTQKKRQFFKGMKKLFKIGNERENKTGDGYILGPWWWLTQGLRRNEEEFSFHNYFSTFVGPHFQVLYSKPVRQYVYDIFRSVDVDFVYLEDGITYNSFKKVMDIILEHYITQGSGNPIEERHFIHLNGLKVIIDEFGYDDKKFDQRNGYPEPEFVGISKARIMQIFKDRGEYEDEEEPPEVSTEDDYEWLRDALENIFPVSTRSFG